MVWPKHFACDAKQTIAEEAGTARIVSAKIGNRVMLDFR